MNRRTLLKSLLALFAAPSAALKAVLGGKGAVPDAAPSVKVAAETMTYEKLSAAMAKFANYGRETWITYKSAADRTQQIEAMMISRYGVPPPLKVDSEYAAYLDRHGLAAEGDRIVKVKGIGEVFIKKPIPIPEEPHIIPLDKGKLEPIDFRKLIEPSDRLEADLDRDTRGIGRALDAASAAGRLCELRSVSPARIARDAGRIIR